MLLSIIVPVYNMTADNKLNHCLDSLLNQTLRDEYEIIAVDDCSTDDSLSVLRDYERKYPDKIKVVESECNNRQGGAKNRGLRHATGKWLGFVDSDDWVSPDMYEKLINKANETGADLVGCDYSIVDRYTFDIGTVDENNTDSQTGILDEEKHKSHILRSGSMVVKIYLREVVEKNNLTFPEKIFYEDNCAAQVWSYYFTHFERVPEPLYYYLTVPESTTHYISWSKCLDRMKAGECFISESKQRGFYDRYREEIDYRFTELYYQITLFSYMYGGKKRRMKNTMTLKKGILDYVPNFRNNKYYGMMAQEDREFIDLQMKSNALFFIKYILLYGYRNCVKKLRGTGKSK